MIAAAESLFAAIDIGSSAIRMDVAEVRPDGRLVVLDSLKKGVQLGKDAFTEGHLSEESIRAACSVLQDFKKVMNTYGVGRYRAVATSAVRESSNSDTFLDRILMSTGLDVEIIDGSEENRITLSAVLGSLSGQLQSGDARTLLVEVGGGSSDVTLLGGTEPLQSGTFPLGSIRLRAGMDSGVGNHEQRTRLLQRQVTSLVRNVKRAIPLKDAKAYIAIGGDVRFVARALGGHVFEEGPFVSSREQFCAFADTIIRLTRKALVKRYSLSYLDAETLTPALLTYKTLLEETKAQTVTISDASIRAGILRDLMPADEQERIGRLIPQILSAARSLGRKYDYDESHAERVMTLALLLFDELKQEQRMNETHRLYLQVAALLHDVGLYISSRAHHKHSYYLIAHSDLFGLTRRELEIIANIARYHRRALPARSHLPYVSLDRDERMIVSKLAAILRVANALDKEQLQTISELGVIREGDRLVVLAPNVSDLTLDRSRLAQAGQFFSDVFGKRVSLREGNKGQ